MEETADWVAFGLHFAVDQTYWHCWAIFAGADNFKVFNLVRAGAWVILFVAIESICSWFQFPTFEFDNFGLIGGWAWSVLDGLIVEELNR